MKGSGVARFGRSPGEGDIVATYIESVSGAVGCGKDLERSGTVKGGVLGGMDGEEIVASDVHDDESIAGDEAAAVCAGRKPMPFDVEGRFSDQISLIFFLHRT